MIKTLTQNLDLGFFAQSSLLLFFLAFVAICIWAMARSKKDIQAWSDMPFDDPNEALVKVRADKAPNDASASHQD